MVVKIALLYEHPTWSVPLMSRLRERNIEFTAIDVGAVLPGGLSRLGNFDVWVNRVNAMPSAGRPASIVAATGHLLLSLELQGHRIVNGFKGHTIGSSKVAQTALFHRLGLRSPRSIAIHNPADAFDAAVSLGLPVLTKPNIGGSGSGIVRHDSLDELAISIADGTVELGIDGTGLVQELIESADSFVYRIEIVGEELLYSTRQSTTDSASTRSIDTSTSWQTSSSETLRCHQRLTRLTQPRVKGQRGQ